jgi:hypothetical protein
VIIERIEREITPLSDAAATTVRANAQNAGSSAWLAARAAST